MPVLCDWSVAIPFLITVHFSVSKKDRGQATGCGRNLGGARLPGQRPSVLARALPAERELDR